MISKYLISKMHDDKTLRQIIDDIVKLRKETIS